MPGPLVINPPTQFRQTTLYGGRQAPGVDGASLAASTLRYVRKTGSDSNGGTSPADAWLTVTKALTTVASNTWVYIGAGVYRETVSVTVTPTSEVKVIGDVDGAATGDAGMVQLTAYLTNDKTAPSGTSLLNLNGKSNLTFQNIMFVGGSAIVVTATTVTSQNITFRSCSFLTGFVGVTGLLSATCAAGMPLNWNLDRCLFFNNGGGGNSIVLILTTGIGSDYDANFLVQNCSFVGSTAQWLRIANSGTLVGKGGGVRVRDCTFVGLGGGVLTTVASQISTAIPCVVSNCFFALGNSTVLQAGTLGQLVEDYNVIHGNTPRSNVAAGAHSISDGSYAPLFHFGQELQWGGTLRPFGEPMQSSPLRAFGSDGSATPLDVRSGPRPSGPTQVDVGAYQRANTATQELSVVQAGSSAIKITGQGSQDFAVPVSAVATTITIYLRYSSAYVGPLPTLQIVGGTQVGVGNITIPVSTASLNAYAQYSVTINPTVVGIVTVRVVSGDTSGSGIVYADTFASV